MVAYAFLMIDDEILYTYKKVVQSTENTKWKKAMDKEMKYLNKNQTWNLI
jgi:hypothetical protein